MKSKVTRKLGLFTLILFTINSILGAGIFALPGKIYQNMAGNFWIAIFISTLMAIVLSIVFSYAAKYVRKSAGAFSYVKEGLGNFWGSVVGIMKAFTTVLVNATLMSAAVGQISKYIVKLGGFPIEYTSDNFWIGWVIAIVVYTIYTIIVSARNKISGGFVNIITIAKLLPIVLLILVGFAVIGNYSGNFGDFSPASSKMNDAGDYTNSSNPLGSGIITGILGLFYAFLGFDSLANSAEVYKNPQRNIPIALGITIAFLTFVYTILLVIGIGSLPQEILQDSSKSVLAEAAERTVLGKFGFHLVMVGAIVSMLGITFMNMYYTPHVMARMAKDGLFPRFFALRNRAGSYPIAAIGALIMSVLLTFTGGFLFLLQLNVLSRFSQFILTGVAVIALTKRSAKKNGKKKFKWTSLSSVSAILSILIMSTLLILLFIPLNGLDTQSDKDAYYKQLKKLAWSFGLFFAAIIVSYIYSAYNMTLKDKKNLSIIYINDKSWRGKIKHYAMWTLAPWFMYKKEKLSNYKKYYKVERTKWDNIISKEIIGISSNKDSKSYNRFILAKNEGIIEEYLYQKYKSLIGKDETIYVDKISGIFIDYENGLSNYNITLKVLDKKINGRGTREYKMFSYSNSILIKESK